jgi:hypothetical protein
MIAIYNRGGKMDSDLCKYELCINKDTIAFFKHRRGDGLATCLRKAADAADLAIAKRDQNDILKFLQGTQ